MLEATFYDNNLVPSAHNQLRELPQITNINSLVAQRLKEIRACWNSKFGSNAMAVNLLLDLARVDLLNNPELGIEEVINNLRTSVVEKVIADVVGKQDYVLQVGNDDQGNSKVKFGMGWATDIYEKSLDKDNAQIPEFELKRNSANLRNLHEIEYRLQKGEKGVFVEFSPSPDITKEAKARGYDGRDSLFLYHIDPDSKQVKVEQFWFQVTDRSEYLELLSGENFTGEVSDVDIMNQSLFVAENNDLVDKVRTFIERRKNSSTEHANHELKEKVDGIYSRATALIESMRDFARRILDDKNLDLSHQIQALNDFIFNEQLRIRFELWEKGAKTFSADVESKIRDMMELFGGFVSQSQIATVFKAEGCGFSLEKLQNILPLAKDINLNIKSSTMNSAPKSSILFNFDRPSLERPDKCDCKNHSCNKTFYVKNGDPSTYFENCPYCGEDMTC